jgi:hypothetical protein
MHSFEAGVRRFLAIWSPAKSRGGRAVIAKRMECVRLADAFGWKGAWSAKKREQAPALQALRENRFREIGLTTGEEKSPDRHGVFTQSGKSDARAGREGFHNEAAQRALHRCAQRLSDPGEPAAQNNHLRMK